MRATTWAPLAVLGLMLAAPTTGFATDAASTKSAASTVSLEQVTVGMNGVLKVGRWAEVRCAVKASQPTKVRLVVDSIDPDGDPTHHESLWKEIPAGDSMLSVLVQVGRAERNPTTELALRVNVEGESGRLASSRVIAGSDGTSKVAAGETPRSVVFDRPLPQSALTVGMLGLRESIAAVGETSPLRQAPVSLFQWTLADLPEDSLALDALDVLIVVGLPELKDGMKEVLQQWVGRGGHLVHCAAVEAEAFQASGWDWGSIPVAGTSRLRELSGLERFAGKGPRIPIAGSVRATKLGPFSGDVRIVGLDGPLLVRVPYRFGRITFFGLDVDRQPLAKWEPLGDFLRKMIVRTQESTGARTRQRGNQIATPGLTDLATQVRNAQDEFPEINRPSIWAVMGLLVAYVLLLGPIDYFLVHRFLKRPQLTWITFPALVVVATLAAVFSARQVNGNSTRVNQIDVVDVDVASGLLRTRSSLSFYSPETQRYALGWKPATQSWSPQANGDQGEPVASTLIWDGIPEDSFGGMYRAAGAGVARPEYHVRSDRFPLPDLPVSVWATKTVVAQWEHPADGVALSKLTSPIVGQLSGSLIHHLPGDLTDWVLAYGNRVYLPKARRDGTLPSIPPGSPWTPARIDVVQRELNGYLTGTIATRVKSKQPKGDDQVIVEQTPWNPLHHDALDVLRMVTFHDKAEGTSYTGLSNDGLRQWELSPLLDLNRAVLFGLLETPAGTLEVADGGKPSEGADGSSNGAAVRGARTVTVVRLVLPVMQTGTALDELPDYNPNPVRKKDPFKASQDADSPADAEIPSSGPTPAPETPKP